MANRLAAALSSSSFRLAAVMIAAFVAVAGAIVMTLYLETNAALTGQVVSGLRTEADALSRIARERGADALDAAVAERSLPGGPMLYLSADTSGMRLAGNLANEPGEVAASPAGAVFRYLPQTAAAAEHGPRLAVAISADGGVSRRLVVGRDIEDQRAFAVRVRQIFLMGFGGLAMAGLIGGYAFSRAIGRRIEAINATARSIMQGDFARRVPLTVAGDEIDGVADNLNAMLDRIEQLMSGLREVSDNIAHDLKTPLNRLRNRAEAALRDARDAEGYREGLEQTIEQSDEIIKTFNALLLVARLEAGAIEDTVEAFDACAMVRDVAELYEPVAEQAGQSLVVDAPASRLVTANRQLIGQAVANLVDNALKYGAADGGGGSVRVGLAETQGGIEISVSDRGPGIAVADRERALRRFVRLEQSRTKPGTGLGLSLVAAVARLHGGTIRLEDNAPGLRIVVALPDRRAGGVSSPA